MTCKHDDQSFNIYLGAKYLAERAHKVAILESYGQDSSYDKAKLVKEYQDFRESLYRAEWIRSAT